MAFENRALIVVLCALAPTAIVSYIAYEKIHEQNLSTSRMVHQHKTEDAIDDVLTLMCDAETGVRGYTITGQDEYLEPYFHAKGNLQKELDSLQHLTEKDQEEKQLFGVLDPLITKKLDILESLILLRKKEGFDATEKVIATGDAKKTMDTIRSVIKQMHDVEEKRDPNKGPVDENDFSKNVRVACILSAFALVLVTINVFFSRLD